MDTGGGPLWWALHWLLKCNFEQCCQVHWQVLPSALAGSSRGNAGLARRKLVPASQLLMVLPCFPPDETQTNKQKTQMFASAFTNNYLKELVHGGLFLTSK